MSVLDLAVFDDHPVLLDGLSSVLSRSGEFRIVGKGASATELLTVVSSCKVDVAIVDLAMPGKVVEAIPKLRLRCPKTRIIAFTASVAIDDAVRVLEAGAHGYVVKGSSANDLEDAIRTVMGGDTYVTHRFAAKVIDALRNATMRKAAVQAMRLSLREEQIIRLLLRGKRNKEIAVSLRISEKTVKHYMSLLMQKLHARNRIEVVLAAQKLNAGAMDPNSASGPYWH